MVDGVEALVSVPLKTRSVTIAVDSSERSLNAVVWATKHLVNKGDSITILHVQPQPDLSAGVLPLKDEPLTKEAIECIKTHISTTSRFTLDKAKEACKAQQIDADVAAVIGDPRESICKYVSDHPCDMLVVGSRGLGALKSQFLGSVSAFCVQHAAVPVVVVRSA